MKSGKRQNRSKGAALAVIMLVMLSAGCAQTAGDTSTGNRTQSDSDPSSAANTEGNNDSGSDTGTEDVAEQAESGAKMPSFTAVDLNGNTVTESIFSEKDLTVVNIWGTFCGPCVGEMPELGTWAQEMPDNVQLIGLVIDVAGEEDTEHRDLAVSIMEKAGADFTQIIANQDFADILKDVYGVPTTIFVDKEGNIVGDSIIGADVDGYKQFVEEYLDGQ